MPVGRGVEVDLCGRFGTIFHADASGGRQAMASSGLLARERCGLGFSVSQGLVTYGCRLGTWTIRCVAWVGGPPPKRIRSEKPSRTLHRSVTAN